MAKRKFQIAVLPGDGVGKEVVAEAVKVLNSVGRRFSHHFITSEYAIGGQGLELTGVPLPKETLDACLKSDAVLLGAVGAPQYDQNPPALKPEAALLNLRRSLDAYANLRPVVLYDALVSASPLKQSVVEATDLLIVRELTGGIYFGQPRGLETIEPGLESAFNTMRYNTREIERIARIAFQAARRRGEKVHSVDKANVLETSQLWRKVVNEIARDFRDVRLEHIYVDNCAMQLVCNPRQFDVILTENLFGDILSDEAAILTGSIGMLPSASIGGTVNLYEPVHGSAPDIAGKGIANPLAAISSIALMLRYSFEFESEAQAVEDAVRKVLDDGLRTADLYRGNGRLVSTEEMGTAVAEAL